MPLITLLRPSLGWFGLGWFGLGWFGLGWFGLGLFGLGWFGAPAAEGWLAEAENLLAHGDPHGAAAILERHLGVRADAVSGGEGAESSPPRAWELLGTAWRHLGDLEGADAAFQRGAGAGAPSLLLFSAECRLEMKNPEGAEEALESFLRSGPAGGEAEPGRIEELRGMVLVLNGREEGARPFLERARSAGRSGASHPLGLAAFHRADHRAARGYFEEAIRAQPDDYYSRLYLGWTHLELGDLAAARKELEGARSVAATAEVDEFLGRVELRAERFEAARDRFLAALERSPALAEAQFGLATALRRLGKSEEAKRATEVFRGLYVRQQEELRRSYRLHQRQLARPQDPSAAEDLGELHLRSGDLQSAERLAWQAIRLDPARESARILLARALSSAGRFREASVQYQRILRKTPDQAVARRELEELIRAHARRRTEGPEGDAPAEGNR